MKSRGSNKPFVSKGILQVKVEQCTINIYSSTLISNYETARANKKERPKQTTKYLFSYYISAMKR